MWKVLKFFIIAAILVAIAWGVASLPGTLDIVAGSYRIHTSVPVAILAIVLLLVLVLIVARLVRAIRRTPARLAHWRDNKRQMAGDTALQRGLVAIAAGDAKGAQTTTAKARALLGDTALVQWLEAEAARLAGQTDIARQGFERLTQSKELKFLGHQGMLRETMQAGQLDAAATQAAEAEAAWPGGTWTRQQRLALALKQLDYPTALTLATTPTERAALAVAAARQAQTPGQALKFAKLAMKADASAPIVAATLAQALRKAGKNRGARKLVLKSWKQTPTPLLAESWFAPNATKLERAKDATILVAANPGHVESELLLAQTNLDANLPGEARTHAEKAEKLGNGDGRAAAILAQLDKQTILPPASAWRCVGCQTSQDEWSPVCPACGKIGTLAPSVGQTVPRVT